MGLSLTSDWFFLRLKRFLVPSALPGNSSGFHATLGSGATVADALRDLPVGVGAKRIPRRDFFWLLICASRGARPGAE